MEMNIHKEEKLVIEIPEWALDDEVKFFEFWDELWRTKGEEITAWLDSEKPVEFRREGADEDE